MELYDINGLTYETPYINTQIFKHLKMIYADQTASGQMSPIIDEYIKTKIALYYGNTHSNDYCGILMNSLIDETRNYIRMTFNLTDNESIIFTGNGTTGAINHLVHCLNPIDYKEVNIILSSYEHNSNYLPWIELSKEYKNVKIHMIPTNDDFTIDINYIKTKLNELCKEKECLTIISITACSNVSGIKTDFEPIIEMIKKYENVYMLGDFACLAPYEKIDGSKFGAIFFSPHKFLGGMATPGILIAKKCLFMNETPYAPGGGCVVNVTRKNIQYYEDIEKKESGGTPNIIGIIRVGLVLKMRDKLINKIKHNEEQIINYVMIKMNELMKKYDKFKIVFQSKERNRLPIICITIKNLHYNFVVTLMNDLFGIQTRGGISCCGLLGEIMTKEKGINGWCRITFHYTMNKKIIDYIINAIEFIIKNGIELGKIYKYDKQKELFVVNHEIKLEKEEKNKLFTLLKRLQEQ